MRFLEEREWLLINDIILSIYATPNLEKMRKFFLKSLRVLISYDKAMFDFGTNKENNIIFFDPVAVNIKEEHLRKYFEYYQKMDYTLWIFAQSNAIVYRDTELIDNRIREKTEIFNDWMLPMDTYFTGGTSIIHKGILLGSLTLFRSEISGDFSDKDLFILNILNGHLSNRLIQIQQRNKTDMFEREDGYNFTRRFNLTNREIEIIELVFAGLTNQEISNRIFVSPNTVKKHVQNIFRKLEVKSRTQLIKVLLNK